MIIIDTREQNPLWDPSIFSVKRMKLDEGDYTTDELLNKAHVERKSGIDLYSSLIQNHNRFMAEIQRAIEKDLSFAVFVECSEKVFISKRFKGGFRLKMKPAVLAKILQTVQERYPIKFYFCKNRDKMRDMICLWFVNEAKKLEDCIDA